MYGTAEFLYRSVLVFLTSYFSVNLLFVCLNSLLFGNIWLVLLFKVALFAKLRQSCFLLVFNDVNFKLSSAFS